MFRVFSSQQIRTMSKKSSKSKQPAKSEISAKVEPSAITKDKSDNILIAILAKPGARQNAITDISSEGVGVQINAPPSEGEANAELVKYMSSVLGIRKGDVSLEKGFKSRNKTLKIFGGSITVDDVHNKISKEIIDCK